MFPPFAPRKFTASCSWRTCGWSWGPPPATSHGTMGRVSRKNSFITFMEVIHEKMFEHSIAFPCFPEINLEIEVKVVIVQFGSGKTLENNTKPMNDVSHKIGWKEKFGENHVAPSFHASRCAFDVFSGLRVGPIEPMGLPVSDMDPNVWTWNGWKKPLRMSVHRTTDYWSCLSATTCCHGHIVPRHLDRKTGNDTIVPGYNAQWEWGLTISRNKAENSMPMTSQAI